MVQKLKGALNFGVPTTSAIVIVGGPAFENLVGNPDSAFLAYPFTAEFNGIAPPIGGDRFVVPVGAGAAAKQNALRNRLNLLLQVDEPGVTLTNADIILFPGVGI